ncbi:signal peptidase II [Salinivibrio sp. ES.052]|uniref:signal peptidase II n=1 Tax=Salinivibrio sp. ES.052 TaxID=1882823 RepID=UPI000929B75A|nr:signal peptidase II [Salinivibrio sp. ES.052]SIN72351.1 signal peptidase II Aspartic peptidase. MEROPS family A08 [Salinivibrio sp. ES.052]
MQTLSLSQSGWRWLWLAPLVFALDIGSKWLVMQTMEYGFANRIELLPFFNLTYVHNHGAAFSFLSDAGGWQRWLFSVIALGVSGLLAYWMRITSAGKRLINIAYAMIIGGALGNLFDRLVHGYVIDFLDFYIGTSHWPAFNLADSAICLGAALVIVESFRHDQSSTK